jgi:hypothetical protein
MGGLLWEVCCEGSVMKDLSWGICHEWSVVGRSVVGGLSWGICHERSVVGDLS